jgi:spore maturation protein CgeB
MVAPLRRVLLYYITRPPIMDHLRMAFARRGIEAVCADAQVNTRLDRYVFHPINKQAHNFRILPKNRVWFAEHPLTQRIYRERVLLDTFRDFRPDMALMIRGLFGIRIPTLETIRREARLFGWWIESDDRRESALEQAPLYDRFYFMNSALQREAVGRGLEHTAVLHHAVDSEAFFPIEGILKDIDLCFVGSWSESRNAALMTAYTVTRNIAICGRKWRKRLRGHPLRRNVVGDYLSGEALVTLYNRSRIVLNHTGWGDPGTRSGFTMRILEVPACGSLLLTDFSEDMAPFVTPGEHVVVYRTPEEMAARIGELLANPALRAGIERAGRDRVRNHFGYGAVVDRLAEDYSALR